ncbi:MAG: hypothetical protein HZA68_07795 [Rhodovulum sp.]|nr:hypothetical protein [Rhodovulum sp.]
MGDPRDEIVEVDGVKMRRGDTPAFRRIWEDEITGSVGVGPDGTVIRDGKVVKAGPRAIVGPDGTLIGMRPE